MAKTTALNLWRPPGGALKHKTPNGRKLILDPVLARVWQDQVSFLHHRNKEQRPAALGSHWWRFSETNRGLLVVKDAVALPSHHEIFRLGC